jgi:hypothetical protein
VRRNVMLQVLLSLLLVLPASAFAVIVNKLYTVVIQVPDNSAATRSKILPQAFNQLLRKVASSRSILT